MRSVELLERETSHHVIGAFFEVYSTLGFGFLEHVYREALERELVTRARTVQKEVIVPVWYKGEVLTTQRVDLIVDESVLVEIKSTEVMPTAARRQLLNYLRATSFQVGLLLHFGPSPRFYRLVHSDKDQPGSSPR
jgi:GxxExxY protein